MCKRLELVDFLDKDVKPLATRVLWDVKEPTHCSKRVGDVVPGVVVCLYLCFHLSFIFMGGLDGWVRSKYGLKAAATIAFTC